MACFFPRQLLYHIRSNDGGSVGNERTEESWYIVGRSLLAIYTDDSLQREEIKVADHEEGSTMARVSFRARRVSLARIHYLLHSFSWDNFRLQY